LEENARRRRVLYQTPDLGFLSWVRLAGNESVFEKETVMLRAMGVSKCEDDILASSSTKYHPSGIVAAGIAPGGAS
jgi:hypothetical protein